MPLIPPIVVPPIIPPIVQGVGGLLGGVVGGVAGLLGLLDPSESQVPGVATPLSARLTMPTSFGGSAIARARALYAAGGSVPQWVPPAFLGGSPSVVDDEFDAAQLSAAWKFFGYTAQANVAISGTTSRDSSSATPRASMGRRRSWLNFQMGTTHGAEGYLTKPFSMPGGDWFLWCRAQGDGGANPARTQLFISPDHPTVPDAPKAGAGIASYLAVGHGNTGGSSFIHQADATNGAGNTTGFDMGGGNSSAGRPEYFGIWRRGSTYTTGVWYEGGETLLFASPSIGWTPTRVGFRMLDAGGLQSLHCIDFVRLDTYPKWSH